MHATVPSMRGSLVSKAASFDDQVSWEMTAVSEHQQDGEQDG